MATWKTLSAFFNDVWVSIALEVVGYVAFGETAVVEIWSGSR